jgi:predicted glycoside hydrolase/deacetylase ChbG (UPF0249 family)
MKRQLRSRGIPTSDFFIDDFWGSIKTELAMGQLKKVITELELGTTELLCHPGYVDEELSQTSLYSHQRVREISLFCSSELREALSCQSIELVSSIAIGL